MTDEEALYSEYVSLWAAHKHPLPSWSELLPDAVEVWTGMAAALQKAHQDGVAQERKVVSVHTGTSCLTKDLIWCECRRGLSLTGKWLYCPSCGGEIDQDSYASAVEQAIKRGAELYRIVEDVTAILEADRKARLDCLRILKGYEYAAGGPSERASIWVAKLQIEQEIQATIPGGKQDGE